MDRQSDRATFQDGLDRVATGNYGEDSVYSESAENERIGELVQNLISKGQLRLGDDGMHNTGYFVMLSDGPTHIVERDTDLLDALEKVWSNFWRNANA